MFNMNKLSTAKRVQIVKALVEGNSLRSTQRMVGCSFNTVVKLMLELGAACEAFHDAYVRNVPAQRVQCDEIWTFCYARRENVPEEFKGVLGYGDLWTWVGQDADSKMVLSWHVGRRDADTALPFMHDLASRLTSRVQLTTDGLKAYLVATDSAFGTDIDYARLIKVYGSDPNAEKRYTPPVCMETKVEVVSGDPAIEHISTSYIERQNLQMRMSMRRYTRLTNGHSKKMANHEAMLALHYVHYNFGRAQKAIGGTPAMAAGLATRVWSVEDIISLLDAAEKKAA
jgi:IS1 family transposase